MARNGLNSVKFQVKFEDNPYQFNFYHREAKRFNPLSFNPTKCLNTLKQFVGKLLTNCLSVFDYFVELPLLGFKSTQESFSYNCHNHLFITTIPVAGCHMSYIIKNKSYVCRVKQQTFIAFNLSISLQ